MVAQIPWLLTAAGRILRPGRLLDQRSHLTRVRQKNCVAARELDRFRLGPLQSIGQQQVCNTLGS
jgi:hypothetical protein